MAEPTIEDLQAQIIELKKSNDTQAQEIESLKTKSAETESNLNKARELNASLLLKVSSDIPSDGTQETPDDTVNSLCDEIVASVNEKYIGRFKHGN